MVTTTVPEILTFRGARIRAVVSDLDGTLLRPDGTVSDYSLNVLARLQQQGVQLIVATARPVFAMMKIISSIPHQGMVICSNGAQVLDTTANHVPRTVGLKRNVALNIVGHVRATFSEATIAIDAISTKRASSRFLPARRKLTRVIDPNWATVLGSVVGDRTLWPIDARALPYDSILCVMVNGAWIDHRDVPHTWPVHVTSSKPGLIEFSATSATKVAALRWISNRIGIPLEEMIAFGDMPNDLDFLRAAGAGIAVANAHPDVARHADACAPSNAEDGVAQFLEALLF
jgi:Cof subfamily protein (haloacid dehalogenase superfamily)